MTSRYRDPKSTRSSKRSLVSKCWAAGVARFGCKLSRYLDQHNPDLQLPRYLARIRTGNEESFSFLVDDDARARFYVENEIGDVYDESFTRQVNHNGSLLNQRISVHEIYEAPEMSKVLKEIERIGA